MTQHSPSTYDGYQTWLVPVNLAVGFHLLVALSIVFLPGMFKTKPKFEDIYTVNLISMNDQPAAEAPAPPAEPPPPQQPLEPEPIKPDPAAVSITPPTEAPPEVVPKPVEPVSLKPLKKKIKKKVEPEENRDLARQKEAERLRRQRLAEALRAEQEAAEQARIAAEEAARQQRLLEQQLAQIRQQARATASTPTRSGSGASSTLTILEKQYLSTITGHIQRFWALPDLMKWDADIRAVVVITVAQNGTIVRQFFEQKSSDPTFDQFVRKTLQDANPLPAIPPALRKNNFEVGLVFSLKGLN